MDDKNVYDAVVVGAGHNGLIAACYLARAGLRVLVLEKNERAGGATHSARIFKGLDARVSVYSYLVSLLPGKILSDLGLRFETRRRAVASYTPARVNGRPRGLLISNMSEETTRQSFTDFTGDESEYERYQALQEKLGLFARRLWPTLLEPLLSKKQMRDRFETPKERGIWDYLVEKPLSALIEDHLRDDAVRGLVFTDAKIGVSTYPDDPSLRQNRTFIYHITGQGTGEWRVPVGGMGALVEALLERARSLGVDLLTGAEVTRVDPGRPVSAVTYRRGEQEGCIDARYVLFNAPAAAANRALPGLCDEQPVEGSVYKINMLLKKLPALHDRRVTPEQAFAGTFHLNEGYEHMKESYNAAQAGHILDDPPGEMYCHSLTDPSILSPELQAAGWQTLTLFGLDAPYGWFRQDNEAVKRELTARYLRAVDRLSAEEIDGCLALDADGRACLDARSPLDLESGLGLPLGNIFHDDLSWPFAEREDQVGTWGVETRYERVLLCGSSARRGGAVSGIPGHNAAMRVLASEGREG